ncbi:MAG: hypothetical protein HN909_00230 [Phycisphaerales bacterium]|jgi:hypothetical protein|nr:hypothetical protein [Phycisphaerales bacterium]MBT7170177.1 hypothetical protein [Phycisphaerales bacterium]
MKRFVLTTFLLGLLAAPVLAQSRTPYAGYLHPAGGKRGTTIRISLGGQLLTSANKVILSGTGVRGKIVQYNRAMANNQIREMGYRLRDMALERSGKKSDAKKTKKEKRVDLPETHPMVKALPTLSPAASKAMMARLRHPTARVQTKRAIAEQLEIDITIDANAAPGPRELRILTKSGLSNPIRFFVGTAPDHVEPMWFLYAPAQTKALTLPVTIHGQLLPRQTDRYTFKAQQGQTLVIQTRARELVPFMSDSVPGWFQPVILLTDTNGKRLAYGDDFRFNPDPTITFTPPASGEYVLEIRDSIYRGREDFVYQITIGKQPVVTSMFPLGLKRGTLTHTALEGWNLPTRRIVLDTKRVDPALALPQVFSKAIGSTSVLYHVDSLLDVRESNVNDTFSASQRLPLGRVINGRIERPGDVDVFCFDGKAGQTVVAEITARQLNSPLDSILHLMDATGKVLAHNDDNPDAMNIGLKTHHADSYLRHTLPRAGTYYLRVSDTRSEGSPAHGYRLRLGVARPDFQVYMVPSSLTLGAAERQVVTVHVDRKDGFTGPIQIDFASKTPGMEILGNTIPAGANKVMMVIAGPPRYVNSKNKPGKSKKKDNPIFGRVLPVSFRASATIDKRPLTRRVIPADDITQAFVLHHLVPAEQCLVALTKARHWPQQFLPAKPAPLSLVPGTTKVLQLAAPKGVLDSTTHTASFSLVNAPKGVTLKKAYIKDETMFVPIVVEANSDAAKGFIGNLVLEAFQSRKPGKDPKTNKPTNTKANSVGPQPPIPCTIIAERPAPKTK